MMAQSDDDHRLGLNLKWLDRWGELGARQSHRGRRISDRNEVAVLCHSAQPLTYPCHDALPTRLIVIVYLGFALICSVSGASQTHPPT